MRECKRVRDIAEQIGCSYDTCRQYLCRPEFSKYLISNGKIYGYDPDIALKLHRMIVERVF